MKSETKKKLIISGVVIISLFVAIKLISKKKKNTSSSNNGIVGGGDEGGGTTNNQPDINATSVIGMKATAKTENVYVRKDAGEYSNIVYNNIVGVLSKNERAGVIQGSQFGTDGKLWYYVTRDTSYNCSYWTCGFHLDNSSGYVKASDVNIS